MKSSTDSVAWIAAAASVLLLSILAPGVAGAQPDGGVAPAPVPPPPPLPPSGSPDTPPPPPPPPSDEPWPLDDGATGADQATDEDGDADLGPSDGPDHRHHKPGKHAGKGKHHKDAKDAKESRPDRELRFGARFFVRDTFDDATWGNDLQLASARAGFAMHDRKYDVDAELEVEMAERKADIKDAWLRYEATKQIRIQVGNFKRPLGAITLASRWALPVAERGLVGDLVIPVDVTNQPDKLPVGGRDFGAAVIFRPRKDPPALEVTVGIFRSAVHQQLAETVTSVGAPGPIGWDEHFPEDVNARVTYEPREGIVLGVAGAWLAMLETAGDRESFRHGYLGSVDAMIDHGGLRIWADAFLGTSPLHFGTALTARGRFWAARLLPAYAVPVVAGRLLAIEPFALVQALDGSSAIDSDRGLGVGGGVAFHFAGDWRVTASMDHTALEDQLGADVTRFFLQLGARFRS